MLASLLLTGALLAAPFPQTIPVPPGSEPEGIAAGTGAIGYSSSRLNGAVYRFNARTGKGKVLVRGRKGRASYGMKLAGGKLYASGGPTGFLFVYDARTGRTLAAVDVQGAFVNDVTVTSQAAYFTDSGKPVLYVLPVAGGQPSVINLTGDWQQVPNTTNANGIVSTPDGKTLIVVQGGSVGKLLTVDPASGAATQIDLGGATVTNGDGLLLEGRRLYVVRNQANEIAVVRLDAGLRSGRIVRRIKDADFDTPTTLARIAGRLYAVNARFTVQKPTAKTKYQVVRVG
jgi:sugar lactone lactonase YvrE